MLNIKKLFGITIYIVFHITLFSCSYNISDLNINPTRATTIDPNLLFANCAQCLAGESLQGFALQYGTLSCVVQHLVPVYTTEFDLYRSTPTSTESDVWQFLYAGYYNMHSPLRVAQEIINFSAGKLDLVNVGSAARVIRVIQMQRITDIFGDVPYFDAGKGSVPASTLTPRYDSQEIIYIDMLNELKEAAAAFDVNKQSITNDPIYQGDLEKWRRFANTLRLRLAMRISKASPVIAKQHGEEAIRGGVLRGNDDNAYIDFLANNYWYRNPLTSLTVTEDLFALSETLVERLTTLNDPRLAIFSDKTPALGLPNGELYEAKKQIDGNKLASRPSKYFCSPDFSGIYMICCAAEGEFLLAEASLKSWSGTQSTQIHYERGIRAALTQYIIYAQNPPIISISIQNAYIRSGEVMFNLNKALEQIHTQKWLALFLDGYEPYAEYRRTGFPRLKALKPSGSLTGGAYPLRLLYPPSEFTFNKANVESALARAGAGYDKMLAPVWWNK